MVRVKLDLNLAGNLLSEDLYSTSGILLLQKSTRLTDEIIGKLALQSITEVSIQNKPASEVTHQLVDIYGKDTEFKEGYIQSLTQLKTKFEKISQGEKISLTEMMAGFSPLLETTLKNSFLFTNLHKIKGFDDYTYRHSLNVGLLASLIGKILGLSESEIVLLGQMGLLHDIGKVKVDNTIINKPGRLTEAEFEKMKLHTIYGQQLLQEWSELNPLVAAGALSHHERLNGSGYPQGLTEKQLPYLVQILAIADTYDAICTDRVYKMKNSPLYAAEELVKGGYSRHFNPEIVIPFVRFFIQGYVGSQVQLNNGAQGEILLIPADEPLRPLIRSASAYYDLRKERSLQIVSFI